MKRMIAMASLAACLLAGMVVAQPAHAQRTFEVKDFTEVVIGVAGEATITHGSEYSVKAEGSDKALEDLDVEVRGGELRVNWKRSGWGGWGNNHKVTLTIVTPMLEGAHVSGSSDVRIGEFTSDRMSLSVAGSGDIVLEGVTTDRFENNISGSGSIHVTGVKAGRVRATISGSGDIELAGEAGELGIRISGSGSVDAIEMPLDEVDVSISGSGDVRVHARELLVGHISGSGDVRYRGRPKVDLATPGSGSVRSVE